MAKSIITNKQECFVCHTTRHLEVHHVLGAANRKWSDKYGLVVPLCPYCHRSKVGVHQNRDLDLKLKRIAQKAFVEEYPDLSFTKIFGRNYI